MSKSTRFTRLIISRSLTFCLFSCKQLLQPHAYNEYKNAVKFSSASENWCQLHVKWILCFLAVYLTLPLSLHLFFCFFYSSWPPTSPFSGLLSHPVIYIHNVLLPRAQCNSIRLIQTTKHTHTCGVMQEGFKINTRKVSDANGFK